LPARAVRGNVHGDNLPVSTTRASSLRNRTRRSVSLPSVTATSGCLLLSLSASPLLSWAASPPYEVIGKLTAVGFDEWT
ncbi:MAG: hypothetical protein IKR48_13270, partial [Kiritimatiellae bacterium]|nr:hypothetical protein [Kiritimatiellia bacterium]